MEKERRVSSRIKRPVTVQYAYALNENKKKWDMTILKDISMAGMCIFTNRPFPAGETLYFRIKFPHIPFQWIEFKGRVIESKGSGYITRIEFIDLTKGQLESILKYKELFKTK